MVEIRNLSFAFGSRVVLRDVSFVVSPGEIVSVVGANGAGKTTLVKVLATLAVADGGMMLVDGQNAFEHPMKLRRQLGYLPERTALCDDMRVKDYLLYRARLKGEASRRIRRRVTEAAELCRITEWLREPIRLLSAGVARRVALADALLLRPRVLLLDDFLAGLDQETRETAGAVLADAAAFSSVLVTGHELSDFASWTTRFLVLRDGEIKATIPTAGTERQALLEHIRMAITGGEK